MLIFYVHVQSEYILRFLWTIQWKLVLRRIASKMCELFSKIWKYIHFEPECEKPCISFSLYEKVNMNTFSNLKILNTI